MLNNTFVLDTSALLKGSKQIFSILKKQKLRAIIPSIVIEELDNIKDNPSHKENRGAHKVLQHIHAFEAKDISERKREQGVKNDTLIMQCAKELNAWIIGEDKTFSIRYERVLAIADFRDKFESYNENIPVSIAKELFCTLTKQDFAKAQEIVESSKNTPWKINAYDDRGFTPLIYAVQSSCATLVEALLYNRYINPALERAGWDFSDMRLEQSIRQGYTFTLGKMDSKTRKRANPKKADYVLYQHGFCLAVLEAKSH